MSDQTLKQLKIKIASVRRIRKELSFYEDDAVKEQARFDSLKASNVDPHDLHQAENVLLEAKAMIPDSKQRLDSAIRDLKNFLSEEGEEFAETETLEEAHQLLTEVQPLVL
eukprot:g583.t1